MAAEEARRESAPRQAAGRQSRRGEGTRRGHSGGAAKREDPASDGAGEGERGGGGSEGLSLEEDREPRGGWGQARDQPGQSTEHRAAGNAAKAREEEDAAGQETTKRPRDTENREEQSAGAAASAKAGGDKGREQEHDANTGERAEATGQSARETGGRRKEETRAQGGK